MNKTKLILRWMQQGRGITSAIAFEQFGTTRLSGIIYNLKKKGFDIHTEMVNGKDRYGNPVRYAVYTLALPTRLDVAQALW